MNAVIFLYSFPEGLMQPDPYDPLPPIKKGDMLSSNLIHPEVLRVLRWRGLAKQIDIKKPKPSIATHQKLTRAYHVKISKKKEGKKVITLDRWLK